MKTIMENALLIISAVVAVGLLLGLLIFLKAALDEQTEGLFDSLSTDKFFNDIEEFRRDFTA